LTIFAGTPFARRGALVAADRPQVAAPAGPAQHETATPSGITAGKAPGLGMRIGYRRRESGSAGIGAVHPPRRPPAGGVIIGENETLRSQASHLSAGRRHLEFLLRKADQQADPKGNSP
jgi:hypothetical protein